jgi:hypothetical protein
MDIPGSLLLYAWKRIVSSNTVSGDRRILFLGWGSIASGQWYKALGEHVLLFIGEERCNKGLKLQERIQVLPCRSAALAVHLLWAPLM